MMHVLAEKVDFYKQSKTSIGNRGDNKSCFIQENEFKRDAASSSASGLPMGVASSRVDFGVLRNFWVISGHIQCELS